MKKIFLSLAFIVLIGLAVFLLLSSKKVSLCDSFTDMSSIINTNDIDKCQCLKDEIQILKCQSDLRDKNLYDKAISETDINICDTISLVDMKNSCLNLVQSKIDYIKEIESLEVNINNQ